MIFKKISAFNIMEPVDKQVESQPKAAPEQVESQPTAAPDQTEKKPKNPKRVEQGRKLAECNKQNKQRLSHSVQPVTQPATQPATQVEMTDEIPLKHKTKDYVLLAETILIVGLVGVGLYYFANQNDQPVEDSVKKRAHLLLQAARLLQALLGSLACPKDDVFDM